MKDPIGLIAQKGQRLRLECIPCGHQRDVDVAALGERVGLGMTLAQLQRRSRCAGSGAKGQVRMIVLG